MVNSNPIAMDRVNLRTKLLQVVQGVSGDIDVTFTVPSIMSIQKKQTPTDLWRTVLYKLIMELLKYPAFVMIPAVKQEHETKYAFHFRGTHTEAVSVRVLDNENLSVILHKNFVPRH